MSGKKYKSNLWYRRCILKVTEQGVLPGKNLESIGHKKDIFKEIVDIINTFLKQYRRFHKQYLPSSPLFC